ncbi:MAG: YlxR family protein [Nocardioides sp.]
MGIRVFVDEALEFSLVVRERQSIPDPTPLSQVRTCVGCRERAPKSELLRIVVGMGIGQDLVAVPDPTRIADGRGAYLHLSVGCYRLATRRRALPRALRAQVSPASAEVERYLGSSPNPT